MFTDTVFLNGCDSFHIPRTLGSKQALVVYHLYGLISIVCLIVSVWSFACSIMVSSCAKVLQYLVVFVRCVAVIGRVWYMVTEASPAEWASGDLEQRQTMWRRPPSALTLSLQEAVRPRTQ